MELTIRINMDNDAFSHGRKAESRRIINEFMKTTSFSYLEGERKTLIDANGNSVGYAEISE